VLVCGTKSDDSRCTRRAWEVQFLVCQANDQKGGVIRREEQGRSDWAVAQMHCPGCQSSVHVRSRVTTFEASKKSTSGCAVDVRRANPLGGDPNDLVSLFSVSGD
jgi:hypothetical protein